VYCAALFCSVDLSRHGNVWLPYLGATTNSDGQLKLADKARCRGLY
jgi:hypothetical protein